MARESASSMPVLAVALEDRQQVAAMDFGTTFSGYAFSLKTEFMVDPLQVNSNLWETTIPRSYKTPTCVLFSPDGTFDSFGHEAEEKYDELCLEGKERDWFYFRHFKMLLYEASREPEGSDEASTSRRRTHRGMMMRDVRERELPAKLVFSAAIGYLKDHMMRQNREHDYGLREDVIHWVLTVPAIWDDASKQFMREAAIKAGIDGSRLSLALEPEAASLYCKYMPSQRVRCEGHDKITCFRPGTKYIILDAGGGTLDMTAHEVQEDGTLKELYKANGGDWGGVKVDEAFLRFLNDVAGPDVMEYFRNKDRNDYNDIIHEFEVKKRSLKPNGSNVMSLRIPVTLMQAYNELNRPDEFQNFSRYDSRDGLSLKGDRLRINPAIFEEFFAETCQQIVRHLGQMLDNPSVAGIDTIVMVGGFSESLFLQEAIQTNFSDKNIILPEEAGLAVLKGAVIFGHVPRTIASRVCQFTYGIEALAAFEPALDDQSRRQIQRGRVLCKDRFSKHAEIEQEFKLGEAFGPHEYVPTSPEQTEMKISVYKSSNADPRYVNEAGCEKIGDMVVTMPEPTEDGERRAVSVKMVFGGTELGIEARNTTTGQITKAAFDFLADNY